MPSLQWKDSSSGQTVSVMLDVTSSETWEDTVTLTDHPVEEGISVTDHAKDEPVLYSVEGVISNVPMPGQDGVSSGIVDLSFEAGADPGTQTIELDVPSPPVEVSPNGLLQAGVGAIGRAISGKPKGTFWGAVKTVRARARAAVIQYAAGRNRPREVHELLLSAKSQKALVTVRSSTRELSDLEITRIAATREPGKKASTRFQIDLRQIRVAASETVESPVPIEARGASAKDAGGQSLTPKSNQTAEETTKSESTLHKLLS